MAQTTTVGTFSWLSGRPDLLLKNQRKSRENLVLIQLDDIQPGYQQACNGLLDRVFLGMGPLLVQRQNQPVQQTAPYHNGKGNLAGSSDR